MLRLISLSLIIMISLVVQGQRNEWVNQAIIVNSGNFETNPPFIDYVTVQSYDPVSHAVTVFNTIYTQSAQDVVINGNKALVCAQDSIILYDLDTYQRIAAVADSGISRLYYFDGKLVVTKQWPVTRFFVEILNATNLALLGLVQNISGDCGEAICDRDSLYVAVNEGFLGQDGKLAVISINDWILRRVINFGQDAIGILNLFSYDGKIYSVNKSPYGVTNQGSITVYNLNSKTFVNKVFGLKFGEGYGIKNNLLYLGINNGVGTFDLINQVIADTIIIPDPGSGNNIFINSGAVDYVNSQLYLNLGNRPPTFGIGVITTTLGDSVTSYTTGINAECMALDYRTPAGIEHVYNKLNSLSLYPNPVSGILYVTYSGMGKVRDLLVTDITGRQFYMNRTHHSQNRFIVDTSGFPDGIYFLTVRTEEQSLVSKFIKQ